MSFKDYRSLRKAKKAYKALLNDFRLYEDVLPEGERAKLQEHFADLRQAIACKEVEDLPSVVEALRLELKETLPETYRQPYVEWFDIIVSALAVAFCFRAYFYEPFQIPTGSMQPTLYGITAVDGDGPTSWDAPVLCFLKWCITGETYQEVTIERPGIIVGWRQDKKPGYTTLGVQVQGEIDTYHIPANIATREWIAQRNYVPGRRLGQGLTLWKGHVRSGDFLFVNRWIWNFRHPEVGETIVFSTQGIHPMLAENTHYIKRLCGRPGDTVELKPDSSYLWVNGEAVLAPLRMSEIAEHKQPWEGAPHYAGYQAAPVNPDYETFSTFNLGVGEYVALGDNSDNSLDSRYWGKVPARNLLGPASFVHWPFTSPRWGIIR